MSDEDVVDTMRDDILEAMKKISSIYDDYDSSCEEEHEMDDNT